MAPSRTTAVAEPDAANALAPTAVEAPPVNAGSDELVVARPEDVCSGRSMGHSSSEGVASGTERLEDGSDASSSESSSSSNSASASDESSSDADAVANNQRIRSKGVAAKRGSPAAKRSGSRTASPATTVTSSRGFKGKGRSTRRQAEAEQGESTRIPKGRARRQRKSSHQTLSAPSPEKVEELAAATGEGPPQVTPPVQVRRKKNKGAAVGVRCEKTLELDQPIRNAICVGREVWTVDWQGHVAIRDREDAAKVTAEIPTSRFVWCMLHTKPGLMWMGQEAHGIALFDVKRREFKDTLIGGHSGGVLCLVADDGNTDNASGEADSLPPRRAWSGSNDFTIRQWLVETWGSKRRPPAAVSGSPEAVVVDLGKWRVGIVRGQHMHGHKNGVRALLKLGPLLWSASDDGTIRIWRCADSECLEVVEAHQGSVNRLAIVRSSVWSAGADGTIKEWSIGGCKRQCLRQITPPGCERGIYALLPLGHDVWVCGHHPAIQVLSQLEMKQTSEEDGHIPYVSNLIGVDRMETKVVWSTSVGDRRLKVWKHSVRGEAPSVDELKAANMLYEEEQQTQSLRVDEYIQKIASLENKAAEVNAEHNTARERLSMESEDMRASIAGLEVQKLQLEQKLEALGVALERGGRGSLASDAAALEFFCARAAGVEDALGKFGLQELLSRPDQLAQMLDAMTRMHVVLHRCGLDEAATDPSILEAILKKHEALKTSLELRRPDLFEEPKALAEFLDSYADVSTTVQAAGVEQDILASGVAMQEFLDRWHKDGLELKGLREEVVRLQAVDKLLASREEELAAREAELASAEAAVKALTTSLEKSSQKAASLEHKLEMMTRDLQLSGCRGDCLEEELLGLKKMVAEHRAVFDDARMGHLMDNLEARRAFVASAARLHELLQERSLEHLLDDGPDELIRCLDQLLELRDALQRHDLSSENVASLEDVLSKYGALRQAFEGQGFHALFEDPAALVSFLQNFGELRLAFSEAGLSQVLDSTEAVRVHLKSCAEAAAELARLRDVFKNAGLDHLLHDSSGDHLRVFLERAGSLEKVLHDLGLERLLENPQELGRLASVMLQLQGELERSQTGRHILDQPTLMCEVLSRYEDVKGAFGQAERAELFEDGQAINALLLQHARNEQELPELRERAATLDAVEQMLAQRQLELAQQKAEAEGLSCALDAAEAKNKRLQDKLADLSQALAEAQSKDKENRQREALFESIQNAFTSAGLQWLLEDSDALTDFLCRAKQLEDLLHRVGMGELLKDGSSDSGRFDALEAHLGRLQELKRLLVQYGFQSAIEDPSSFVEVLSRYNLLQKACEEHGFPELFDDPYTMKGFLRNYGRIKEEFRNAGDLEYLLDSAPAMRDFLAKHAETVMELQQLRECAARVESLEQELQEKQLLSTELAELRAQLSEFQQLGSLDQMRRWKEDSAELVHAKGRLEALGSTVNQLEEALRCKEEERRVALERERLMSVKYKELDIFKLDIIARELKALDNELQLQGSAAKSVQRDATKLRNYDEQQAFVAYGDTLLEQCRQLRSHIRDVISKCLSETQKMHIGVAIDDYLAAGDLKDGGTHVKVLYEEVEKPDHGRSNAARLRQQDETGKSRLQLPPLHQSPRLPERPGRSPPGS